MIWVSKLQTEIALSTVEAEYVALSQSMRDLIALREIQKEIFRLIKNFLLCESLGRAKVVLSRQINLVLPAGTQIQKMF